MCLSRPPPPSQRTLFEWAPPATSDDQRHANILPAGDKLKPRQEDDGIFRVGYHNIHTTTMGEGFEVAHEIDTIESLGVDMQGMSEINRPWTTGNKSQYDMMMEMMFNQSHTIYSSGEATHDKKYTPGGNLLTINGHNTGRKISSGTDKWGRFCWTTLRGGRDEGIIVINAYRVCHEKGDNPGPFTAYTYQYTEMRKAGIEKPNPRRQILRDILKLIKTKRAEGFRPIVMMDANGDYRHTKDPDKDLDQFIKDAQLSDPYIERFPEQIKTYMYGSKRIDYILTDPALVHAIRDIGYLGSHEGTLSDHVYAYVDFEEKLLFRGIINRPVPLHSREFRIEQKDKVQEFLVQLIKLFKHHKIKDRVFKLSDLFRRFGKSKRNVDKYQKMDREIRELAVATSSKVGKRKYGYMRNPTLTTKGRVLILWKMILDCKRRRAPPTDAVIHRAKEYNVDLEASMERSEKSIRKEVYRCKKELWEAQKTCEDERAEWLKGEAMDRAHATGDKDWEAGLKRMIHTAETRAVNRKLTAITKGSHGTLDRIEVPTHDWFHSEKEQELYRYDKGNFEAYPQATVNKYYKHHSLKVLPPDACMAQVEEENGKLVLRQVYHWFRSQSTGLVHFRSGNDLRTYSPTTDNKYVECTTTNLAFDAMAVAAEYDEESGEVLVYENYKIQALMWESVTTQKEIETRILERNKRHLQQMSIEGGPTECEPLVGLQQNCGVNADVEKILKGTYTTEVEISEEMAAWIKAMEQNDKEKNAPVIDGVIPVAAYQETFKKATESTSSNSTFGLNYTIWKAMASSDYCAEFLCIMLSLPFMYGFVNARWTNETDCMLEKKKGIRKIHTLRIIGLLEADFNSALKWFFSRMQSQSEANGGLTNENWGSRKNRTSIDTSAIKLLSYEGCRLMKLPMGEVSHDLKACFDRMHTSQSNIYAQRQNVDENICLARAKTIEGLRRHAKTGLGVSDETYGNEPGEPRIGGEVQGKGDVPQLYLQQSSVILRAHSSIAPGFSLKSCTGRREIAHHSLGYVDDTEGHVSVDHNSPHPIVELIEKLSDSGQKYCNLQALTGGSSALHKTKWRMIAWEMINGELKLVKATEERIVLEDGNGAISVIDFVAPDKPNEGLGYKMCPDGSMKHQLKAVRESMGSLCGKVASAFLTEKEVRQLLVQRLVPKLSYPLHLTSFTKKESTGINSIIRKSVLPPMHMNRHMPDAVVYGPLEYGGLEFTDAYTLQDQLQIPYWIKQLRWDETVGNNFLVVLDNLQLVSGLVTPVFESTQVKLGYINRGLLTAMHARMRDMDATLWIEEAWVPSLQRVGDASLMERFTGIAGITPRELDKVNQVQLYLRVITIADLANPSGEYIPDDTLTGEWQAGSDLLWPTQPRPRKQWWALFRKCLRLTFCTRSPAYQRASYSMELDRPLGEWLATPRPTWWPCYKTESDIIFRDEETNELQAFKGDALGFYTFKEVVEQVPLTSHPIICQLVGDKYWTRKKYRGQEVAAQEPAPPGHVTHDNLGQVDGSKLVVGSDGSVHLVQQTAAAAWLIAKGPDQHLAACFLLSDVNSVTSYRSELEGIFRSLKHMESLNMAPSEVKQWCDNELSVKSSRDAPNRPASMLHADADLVLTIHSLKDKLQYPIDCRHVYGHQDAKKAKDKESKDKRSNSKSPLDKMRDRLDQCQPSQPSSIDGKRPRKEEQSKTQHNYEILLDVERQETAKPPAFDEETGRVFGLTSRFDLVPDEDDCKSEERDDPKKKKPLKQNALINIACDEIASGTTAAVLDGGKEPSQKILQLPYQGSKAMLRIGKTWITSRLKSEIYKAHRSGPMREYCKEKYKWTDEVFDSVYWESVRSTRKKMTWSQQRQTGKLMHDWLPTMHMLSHITRNKQCPGCNCADETLTHVFRCPNKLMKKMRREKIDQMRKKGIKEGVPRNIINAYCDVLHVAMTPHATPLNIAEYSTPVQDAIAQQQAIGLNMMIRGFLANGWMAALVDSGTPYPERRMKTLQLLTWDDLAFPMWLQRNDILHEDTSNKYNRKEDSLLSAKITWYQQNRRDILSHHDQWLAEQDLSTLHRMQRTTKRAWTTILDKARDAYDNERNQRANSQNVITRYFQTTTQSANGNTTDTNGDTPDTNVSGQLGPTETTTHR